MSDALYVKVGDSVEALDLGTGGGGTAPEYVERIETLEAQNADTLLAAQNAADLSGGSLGDADLNQILSAYEMTQAELATVRAMFKVGAVMAFAANSEPEGYLLCNGATVSRSTYAALFAAIGTTYGTGDGSTTFALPNLDGRVIQGTNDHALYVAAGLPNISGYAGDLIWNSHAGVSTDGVLSADSWVNGVWSYLGDNSLKISTSKLYIDASRSNPIYGASNTVQPPALAMRYYIKY